MRILVLMVLVMLGGCAADRVAQRTVEKNTEGRPAAYKDGYADGCSTRMQETNVFVTGALKRDDVRMKSDADYSLGWMDGSRQCAMSGGDFFYMPRK